MLATVMFLSPVLALACLSLQREAQDTTMAVILTWLEDFDGRSADGSARPGLKAPNTPDPNAEHAPSCR